MGIIIDEPSFVFADKQYVLAKKSSPYLTLKKKSSSITFHFICGDISNN